jgi:predicted permease
LLPLAAFLIEIGSHGDGDGGRRVLRSTARQLSRNPIVMSIIVGILWRLTGIPLAAAFAECLDLLGKAAPALALFCVGASLPRVVGGSTKEAALATTLKLAVLPLAIWGLCASAGLSGLPLKVALVTAAMPTGANAFLVARRVTAFSETSAHIVVVSLVVSIPILSGLLIGLR